MLINGTPVRDTAFKSRLALVWQSDILLPTATVRPFPSFAGCSVAICEHLFVLIRIHIHRA